VQKEEEMIREKGEKQRRGNHGEISFKHSMENKNNIFHLEGFFFLQYFIQHCYICSPSDSTVSEDAIYRIVPMTVADSALAFRRSTTRLDLIHNRLNHGSENNISEIKETLSYLFNLLDILSVLKNEETTSTLDEISEKTHCEKCMIPEKIYWYIFSKSNYNFVHKCF
jgi:hypothetical protein